MALVLLIRDVGGGDSDARLDVYCPTEAEQGGKRLLTVVWTHGGGWISGSKDQVAGCAWSALRPGTGGPPPARIRPAVQLGRRWQIG